MTPATEHEHPPDRRMIFILFALSAAALGHALQRRDGLYDERGFVWLSISLGLCLIGVAVSLRLSLCKCAAIAIGGLIAWQIVQMLRVEHPGSWHGPESTKTYKWMVAALAGAAAGVWVCVLLRREKWARRIFLPLALAVFLVLGFWLLHVVPRPHMDAWEAQKSGLDAFCAGKNPYDAPFPDIWNYPPGYSPGTVVKDGMVHLGFPYPPLILLMDLPGHVIFGDFRYSNLFAIIGAAAFLGYARRGMVAPLAALLFLTTPRTLFILESGFTEPATALLAAATAFAALRRWRWTPILLGLLFASKQYLVIVAPCALLLIPRPWTFRTIARWVSIAVATGLAVSLPIILPFLKDFIRCTIEPIAKAHFRYDALSYLALYAKVKGVTPNPIIGFILAALALPLVLWRSPRSAVGFASGSSLVLLLFFAFSKGAFANYYYLIIAMLCAACAAAHTENEPTASITRD